MLSFFCVAHLIARMSTLLLTYSPPRVQEDAMYRRAISSCSARPSASATAPVYIYTVRYSHSCSSYYIIHAHNGGRPDIQS